MKKHPNQFIVDGVMQKLASHNVQNPQYTRIKNFLESELCYWSAQDRETEIPSLDKVHALANTNKVVEAIRMYRELNGVSLIDAKRYIDGFRGI